VLTIVARRARVYSVKAARPSPAHDQSHDLNYR
jgi:hypothetical protein